MASGKSASHENGGTDSHVDLAIIGGGIAGVCLALGILNHAPHIRLHIYEAAGKFQEIGAGVGFGINARKALRLLDPRAAEAYDRIATGNAGAAAQGRVKTYSRVVMGMDHASNSAYKAGREVAEAFCEGGFSSVHRARFLDEMITLLPPDFKDKNVSFGRRATGVEEINAATGPSSSSGVRINFADGTTAMADAVIGCDGIKSRIREVMFANHTATAVFTGKYAYRSLIPMPRAVRALGDKSARNAHLRIGYLGHVLTFPIDHGSTLNVVAFRTHLTGTWEAGEEWVVPATKEEMHADFAGWGAEVHNIIDLMGRSDKWALFDHPPAPTYHTDGRMCLLGDAAHASTPHQGSGAGMAIEDAVTLSRLLSRCSNVQRLGRVFATYDILRRERTQRLVQSSRDQCQIYDLESKDLMDDVDKIAEVLPSRWDWIWEYDLEEALNMGSGWSEGVAD